MEQNMTLNSTLSEEDKIVDVVQGGLLPWGVKRTPHHGFVFRARTKRSYKKNFKDFFAITHDIMKCFAKDKVVYSSCQYEVKKHGKKHYLKTGFILNISKMVGQMN